ncbi:MAG: hypothetical protein JXR21_03085, partial [Candidatus Marinimicrobia bacterium]|nr:hypothetical protein [Candidatus Neomarinimicrobiota bacterium]
MSVKSNYICSECGREYPITPEFMLCPVCSEKQKPDEPLRGILEVRYTADGLVRLEDLCTVEKAFFPQIPVGNTPL